MHVCCSGHLPYADLNLLNPPPPPLAFPSREALYKNVQGIGCEPQEEDEGQGESTSTPDPESLDETIEDFSYHACPLFNITGKDAAWQCAFDALKQDVTSKPVLLFPDNDSPFCVEANSLDFAMGAVLFQQSKKDGKWHPVVFYSKSLNAVEMELQDP
ncbi:hypothetical protein E4T56_gene18856 [Termitomyces sp. T112]|nr:hypothetical protein E4T56_gene18856 [Termitomyces sp. T112]